jgi:hypothetical protein
MHHNNKLLDTGDKPSQHWVRQLSGQSGMGIAQCVGGLVGTSRIYAAATPVAESSKEEHTIRWSFKGCVSRRHERERRARLGDVGGRWHRGNGGGVFERDAKVHVVNAQAVEYGEC